MFKAIRSNFLFLTLLGLTATHLFTASMENMQEQIEKAKKIEKANIKIEKANIKIAAALAELVALEKVTVSEALRDTGYSLIPELSAIENRTLSSEIVKRVCDKMLGWESNWSGNPFASFIRAEATIIESKKKISKLEERRAFLSLFQPPKATPAIIIDQATRDKSKKIQAAINKRLGLDLEPTVVPAPVPIQETSISPTPEMAASIAPEIIKNKKVSPAIIITDLAAINKRLELDPEPTVVPIPVPIPETSKQKPPTPKMAASRAPEVIKNQINFTNFGLVLTIALSVFGYKLLMASYSRNSA